jgi:hypothetical protein
MVDAPGGIFFRSNGKLTELRERPYDAEEILQELLADHAGELLGADQFSPTPLRWLLVTREMGLPSESGGGDRWSIDHLFLDQEGIPTIVEVKRSSDTRIRREVVGQMLEYAANAVAYWPVDMLRQRFEDNCRTAGKDPADELSEHLGDKVEVEHFWERVQTNLRAGKLRLIFVADSISPELRRIVDFMQGQMNPAQVLAVEVRQYLGQGTTGESLQALVPRIVSQPTEMSPSPSPNVRWTEERFLAAIRQHGEDKVKTTRQILDWATASGFVIHWGSGASNGAFSPRIVTEGIGRKRIIAPISFWTSGIFQIEMANLKDKPPFDRTEKRKEFYDRLRQLPGVQLNSENLDGLPSADLGPLENQAVLNQFLEIYGWARDEIMQMHGQVRHPQGASFLTTPASDEGA